MNLFLFVTEMSACEEAVQRHTGNVSVRFTESRKTAAHRAEINK